MRRVGLVTAWLAALAAPARADDKSDPVPTAVSVTLDGSTAHFAVRYRLEVEGPTWTTTGFTLTSPPHAVVTDATVKTPADAKPRRLFLADAAHAGETLAALGAAAAGSERGWMFLLSTTDSGEPTLGYAAPERAAVDVTVTLSEPTCFVGDTRYAAIPSSWQDRVRGDLIRDTADACDAWAGGDIAWLAFPTREVSSRASGDRFQLAAGGLVAGSNAFARVELDVAGHLGDMPEDLATVFVVDTSRSLSGSQLDAEQAAIAAYLRAAGGSKVQVIGFARKVTPMLSGWTRAFDAQPEIDAAFAGTVPLNGSNLDAALDAAKTWLDRVDGTKRVVVLTDSLLADRITAMPEAALRAKVGGALVHVVDVASATANLTRDDELPLAPLALASGGIAVTSSYQAGDDLDATMLVRPTTIDNLRVTAPGWQEIDPTSSFRCQDNQQGEGSHCVWWGAGAVADARVTVEGSVWGRRVSQVLVPDAGAGLDVARELVALGYDNDDVQRAAYAVDRVWSMARTWGGNDGYDDIGVARYGQYTSHCGGSRVHVSHAPTIRMGQPPPKLPTLEEQLAPALAACGVEHAQIDVELTYLETVDVVTSNACVAEQVWATNLAINAPPAHAHHRVAL